MEVRACFVFLITFFACVVAHGFHHFSDQLLNCYNFLNCLPSQCKTSLLFLRIWFSSIQCAVFTICTMHCAVYQNRIPIYYADCISQHSIVCGLHQPAQYSMRTATDRTILECCCCSSHSTCRLGLYIPHNKIVQTATVCTH